MAAAASGKQLTDCPSNLKEAIDWILRVTGKDGQGNGDGNETKLAKAITELPDFRDAINVALKKQEGVSGGVDISQALEKLSNEKELGPIIGNLAKGLAAFIGYDSKGQGGIAIVIDPLQQLRKGVLMFLSEVIRKLKSFVTNGNEVTARFSSAIRETSKFYDVIGDLSKLKENRQNQISSVVGALKNVSDLQGKTNRAGELPGAVSEYLKGVLNAVKAKVGNAGTHVDALCSQLHRLLTSVWQNGDIKKQIKNVRDAKNTITPNKPRDPFSSLVEGVSMGTESFLKQLEQSGYTSSYLSTSNWDGITTTDKIAQIFLGCLPLYYYWLTYLYWKCKQTRDQGGWEGHNFARPDLKHFMLAMGYNSTHLTRSSAVKGSNIATLLERFDKLKDSIRPSHTDLLTELKKKLDEALNASVSHSSGSTTSLNDNSLSALFYLCRGYFTGKQIMQSKRDTTSKHRPPTSIREMLYWLSGLQFSPHYSSIEKQIDNIVPEDHGLPVADSGISSSTKAGISTGDTLTQSQMKGFLLSSCLVAPGVLGAIQGNSADSQSEPWLYSLFCNSMNLQYPSGSALFNALSNYAYAMQFQLLFLYAQCRSWYSQSYGWQWCRFGQSAQPNGQKAKELASWICSSSNCTTPTCQHNSDRCQHIKECGQANKHSPLQAFLTDNLQGFCRGHPGTSGHLDNHLSTCSGPMCHTPMGFEATHLRQNAGTGNYIYAAFYSFCGRPDTPLRQLSEKLGCLTKRTPRTLGDLFGFVWHLNGQLFKNTRPTLEGLIKKFSDAFGLTGQNLDTKFTTEPYSVLSELWNKMLEMQSQPPSATVLSRSLEAMAPSIPFLYQLFMTRHTESLPVVLFDLKQQCHKVEAPVGGRMSVNHNVNGLSHHNHNCSTSPADLFSLQTSLCTSINCGPYLYPLTHTDGAAYIPVLASAYLSWLLYLTDDFEAGLRDMLERFKGLSCTNCQLCHSGSHGSAFCSCPSIVECSGVLPLLYSNGFSFGNAYSLKGGTQGSESTKRSCQKFHSQVTAVLAQNESTPLFKLLVTIDDFLYVFRFYFFYNLSTFWIMYVCIVLYMYFLRADLLHLKSHVHFPSSHDIPSIGLLPTGKPTVLTKVTKLVYFMI
ncbi:variant erythrocyte surface antigen-1 family protein [Babesia caballi]|uniref:Variant erythrocyte surface antigen-1 family protein n=1 Tax=Babesia caballi TaxID=5871 RepID=A0AAV4LU52_BABCB|nr:variant erythrocyte surface antigen-1 family protein [Babesia caballi]